MKKITEKEQNMKNCVEQIKWKDKHMLKGKLNYLKGT